MRSRIVYSGRVQGVGFRWNVRDVIKHLNLTGTVQNLVDGTVEVVLEGDLEEIKDGKWAIEERMKGYWITNAIEYKEGEAHFSRFSIIG
jgi:acylphosphatase